MKDQSLLGFAEARQIVLNQSRTFGTEKILLNDCLGRILAEPVMADRDYPPFNRAAMDGYALSLKDLEKGIRRFSIAETIFAGDIPGKVLSEKQCYKIMTGAAVPEPADIVIRKEDSSESDGYVQVHTEQFHFYQHISKRGEDVRCGEAVIPASAVCTPPVVSVLAALGMQELVVQKLPKVAIFTTGNEVVAVGQPVTSVQIRNSNLHLFKALLRKWQIIPYLTAHLPDNKDDLYQVIGKAMQADIIIISGGISAGDADYVPQVLESLGVKKLFHKVNIKPGKPVWCGLTADEGIVFALPGNPFSSLVTFTLFTEPYLWHCLSGREPQIMKFPISVPRTKNNNLDEFFPVKIQTSPFAVIPLSFNGSGDILAALHADGILHHPAFVNHIKTGDVLTYMSFNTLPF